jgi:flagellar FliL protein
MILPLLFAQTPPEGDKNVALDDERLQEGVPKGLQKVELDLDDALFLEFEEKEEEPPEPEPEPQAPPPPVVLEKSEAARPRRKLVIFGLAAALCLFLGAGGAYFFMKSGTEPSEEVAEQESLPAEAETEEQAKSPEAENATVKPVVLVAYPMEKFQVEYAFADQLRFLTCRIAVTNVTELMRLEMQTKSIFIRDGIYRYLKNAPLSFLDNSNNSDKLKKDIASVINQHMKSGQVSEILLEEYVVR